MAYVKQDWKDLPDKSTPITAEALNHMEDGISKLDEDIKINYIDNQEVATNEYLNGKRIYAKRFSTTETLVQKGTLSIPMNLPDYEEKWIDVSNSYFCNLEGTSVPILSNYYISYLDDPEEISATLQNDNILIISKGGWGNNWKKVVTVKYTKK